MKFSWPLHSFAPFNLDQFMASAYAYPTFKLSDAVLLLAKNSCYRVKAGAMSGITLVLWDIHSCPRIRMSSSLHGYTVQRSGLQ